jgi:hypothetical protein
MTPSGIASVFMHLAHLGYAAYSQEVNHYVNVPCCCEFSFLRVKAGSDCGMQQV